MLCLCIRTNKNLEYIDLDRMNVNDNWANRILKACSELTSIIDFQLSENSMWFKSQANINKLEEIILK